MRIWPGRAGGRASGAPYPPCAVPPPCRAVGRIRKGNRRAAPSGFPHGGAGGDDPCPRQRRAPGRAETRLCGSGWSPPTRPRRGDARNFLVSAGLADAPARVHLNAMCGRFASYLPPEAIAALFRTVNCQRRRKDASAGRSKTPSRMMAARHPVRGALLRLCHASGGLSCVAALRVVR